MISKLEKPNREKQRMIEQILRAFEDQFWYLDSNDQLWYKFEDRSYSVDEEDEELIDTLIFTVDNAIFFDEEDYCGMSQEEVWEYVEKGDMVELYFKDGIPNTFHIIDDYDIDESFETLLLDKMVAVYKRDTKGNWVVVWKKEVKSDA